MRLAPYALAASFFVALVGLTVWNLQPAERPGNVAGAAAQRSHFEIDAGERVVPAGRELSMPAGPRMLVFHPAEDLPVYRLVIHEAATGRELPSHKLLPDRDLAFNLYLPEGLRRAATGWSCWTAGGEGPRDAPPARDGRLRTARLAIGSLGLLLLFGLGCRGEEKAAPAVPAVPAATASCAGSRVLRIAVQPGDYVHAVADQGARDIALALSDPRGRQLLQVDSLDRREQAAPAGRGDPLGGGRPRGAPDRADASQRLPGALRPAAGGATAGHRGGPPAGAGGGGAGPRPRFAPDRRSEGAGVAPYESAQRRFADLGLPRRRAEALYGLGMLQRNSLHENEAALQTFTRAEPLFAGAPELEAKARGHRGELRYALGDLDGATEEYRRALELRPAAR